MGKLFLVMLFGVSSVCLNAKTENPNMVQEQFSFEFGLTCNDVVADYAERIYSRSGDADLAGRAYGAALKLCLAYN